MCFFVARCIVCVLTLVTLIKGISPYRYSSEGHLVHHTLLSCSAVVPFCCNVDRFHYLQCPCRTEKYLIRRILREISETVLDLRLNISIYDSTNNVENFSSTVTLGHCLLGHRFCKISLEKHALIMIKIMSSVTPYRFSNHQYEISLNIGGLQLNGFYHVI